MRKRLKDIGAGLVLGALIVYVCHQFVLVLDWEAQKAQQGRVIHAVYVAGEVSR